MKVLGKNIRSLRQQHGWSQEDIARKLKISIPAFSKIETGITDVNLSRLEQIATIFEVPVVKLLTLEGSLPEAPQLNAIESINKKLSDRESEISSLQKKVIELYEELRKSSAAAS
jgi:transcriptional regulator with XRE-family HTH domain